MIETIYKDFYQFIKNPDDRQIELNITNKFRFTSILLVGYIIVALVFIIPFWQILENNLNLTYVVDLDSFTVLQLFLFFVLIMPFVEELVFRYFLRYQGIETLIIKKHQWQKLFPFLVYSSVLVFGFVHLFNYTSNSTWFYILSPFIVISQLIGGVIITYVRIRLSFLWGLIFHCIWNFLFIIAIPIIEDFFGIV